MAPRFLLAAAASILLASAALTPSAAQADEGETDPAWTPSDPLSDGDLTVIPDTYQPYRLDTSALAQQLGVSQLGDAAAGGVARAQRVVADKVITVPAPDGTLIAFTIAPLELMEDGLAAAHPELMAFSGHAVNDPTLLVQADLTPLGFHAMVRSADNSTTAWYVDPAKVGDIGTYISYPSGALSVPRLDDAAEETGSTEASTEGPAPEDVAVAAPPTEPGAVVGLRTVRLALSSDPSFATFYGSANVLAAKFSIINRVAGIYNTDLGVRLLLIDRTDELNFDTPAKAFAPGGACGDTACYTQAALASCTVDGLYQNSAALGKILGYQAYDVGHILLGNQGGGIAGYGEIGLDEVKGGGCTGTPRPIGDGFAIDYVAHELGHQFGGSHTFNACGGSSGATAVEPGSGSTIMAYAGICGANDLQPHTDPYFSQASIEEIHRTLDQRIAAVPTTNHAPTVNAPSSKSIPLRTPFTLTATGGDADGDTVTYNWEQNDVGDPDRALFDDGKTGGPLFRVFNTYADVDQAETEQYQSTDENLAGADPTRTFPDLEQILSGTTNIALGMCDPALTGIAKIDCYSEFLPTASYANNLNFRVTARDNSPLGGGVAHADLQLTLDPTAGPLLVTGLGDATSYTGGTIQTLTWAVNGTDAPDLAPQVRILLSLDGGATFPTMLADATPNDGSEPVVLPDTGSNSVRIKIEAVDNYFFAITPTDISLSDAPATPAPTTTPMPTAPDSTTGADNYTILHGTSTATSARAPRLAGTGSGASTAFLMALTLLGAGIIFAVRVRLRRRTAPFGQR